MQVTVRLDRPAIESAKIPLDRLVSVRVEQVTLEKLFEAALAGTGLAFRRQADVIEVFPAK
jgi:hypothetical protein